MSHDLSASNTLDETFFRVIIPFSADEFSKGFVIRCIRYKSSGLWAVKYRFTILEMKNFF